MILAHALVGITAGEYTNYFWFVLIGSIIADVDHLIVLRKNRVYSWKKIVKSMRNASAYGIKYKTKYAHSLFGAIMCSIPVWFISAAGARYFFMSYLGHLLLDSVDHDKKQYFFPFKKQFKGFLPIFSRAERVFTLVLLILMIVGMKK